MVTSLTFLEYPPKPFWYHKGITGRSARSCSWACS
jgi:hypothetical protein